MENRYKIIDEIKFTEKEIDNIERFLKHSKRMMEETSIPFKTKLKTSTLNMYLEIERHNEKIY